MAHAAKSSPEILNSWKEIATYLDRGVRTAQRWERELQLPVHRIGSGKRSPVYALSTELRFWLATVGASAHKQEPRRQPRAAISNIEKKNFRGAKSSFDLIKQSRDLVRTVAEASVRQQRQFEILQKRIREMRSRIASLSGSRRSAGNNKQNLENASASIRAASKPFLIPDKRALAPRTSSQSAAPKAKAFKANGNE
jgi:TolA-binding protein